MPVVVQACFELEPLAGEAGVVNLGAGDGVRPSPGQPDGRPDARPRRIGHLHGPVQMIDVHHEQRRRCGVDARDDGHGSIQRRAAAHRRCDLSFRQPDVLAHRRARRVQLGDHISEHIMNGMRRAVGAA